MRGFVKKYGYVFVGLFVFFAFYKPEVCMLLFGIAILGVYSYYATAIRAIFSMGVQGKGIIQRYEIGSHHYPTPLVKFTDHNGNTIEAHPIYYAASDLRYFRNYDKAIGKEVEVYYLPNQPGKFMLRKKQWLNYTSLVLFLLVGMIFTAIGIAAIMGMITLKS